MSTIICILVQYVFGDNTFSTSLNESSRNKCQIISRIKSMPNSTRSERRHGTSKTRFLPSRSYAKIYIILEPFIGILVPCFQIFFIVLGSFEGNRRDICDSIPTKRSIGIVAIESYSRKNTSSFSHFPYSIIFKTMCHSKRL